MRDAISTSGLPCSDGRGLITWKTMLMFSSLVNTASAAGAISVNPIEYGCDACSVAGYGVSRTRTPSARMTLLMVRASLEAGGRRIDFFITRIVDAGLGADGSAQATYSM